MNKLKRYICMLLVCVTLTSSISVSYYKSVQGADLVATFLAVEGVKEILICLGLVGGVALSSAIYDDLKSIPDYEVKEWKDKIVSGFNSYAKSYATNKFKNVDSTMNTIENVEKYTSKMCQEFNSKVLNPSNGKVKDLSYDTYSALKGYAKEVNNTYQGKYTQSILDTKTVFNVQQPKNFSSYSYSNGVYNYSVPLVVGAGFWTFNSVNGIHIFTNGVERNRFSSGGQYDVTDTGYFKVTEKGTITFNFPCVVALYNKQGFCYYTTACTIYDKGYGTLDANNYSLYENYIYSGDDIYITSDKTPIFECYSDSLDSTVILGILNTIYSQEFSDIKTNNEIYKNLVDLSNSSVSAKISDRVKSLGINANTLIKSNSVPIRKDSLIKSTENEKIVSGSIGWDIPSDNTFEKWGLGVIDNNDVIDNTGSIIIPNDDVIVPDFQGDMPIDLWVDFPIDTTPDIPIDTPIDDIIEQPIDNPIDNPIDVPNTDIIDKYGEELKDYQFDLTELFPFCIPFDIILFFKKLMPDETNIPKFEFNFDFSKWGAGTYSYTIDFTQFQLLATITRDMLFLLFLFSLMKMTRSLIRG